MIPAVYGDKCKHTEKQRLDVGPQGVSQGVAAPPGYPPARLTLAQPRQGLARFGGVTSSQGGVEEAGACLDCSAVGLQPQPQEPMAQAGGKMTGERILLPCNRQAMFATVGMLPVWLVAVVRPYSFLRMGLGSEALQACNKRLTTKMAVQALRGARCCCCCCCCSRAGLGSRTSPGSRSMR